MADESLMRPRARMSSNTRAWTNGMGSYSGSVVRACWMMNETLRKSLLDLVGFSG